MKAELIFKSATAALLCVICVSSFSCKDPDTLGLEVQPVNDKINTFYNDTCSVIAYTQAEDSIRSDKTVLNLLGNYNDPIFGRTSASIYSHVRISSNNVDFGTNAVPDSLVLSLAYDGFYGKLRKLNVKVFEVIEDFYKDSSYYSNRVLLTETQPLANMSLVPNTTDSLWVDGEKLPPHMRIRLSQDLAQKFINESGSANMTDNTTFTEFFKGLYITTSFVNTEGAILYFDLIDVFSQMTLYYHNDDDDSLKFNFVINDYCARFNNFSHYDYTQVGGTIQQQIAGDTLLGDSLLYLQSMSGLKVKLNFPDYTNLFPDNKTVLNKAELIIPVEYDPTSSNYELPVKLTLVRISDDGTLAYLIDQFEGESHFRGVYDDELSAYTFTITRHIQNILLGNINDNGLYLLISGSGINGARVVLRGPGRAGNNMKLKITYTKL